VIALVGYTNAGKSTLLNRLTDAGVLAEDKLFATLDPRARRLTLPDGRETVLTDTVGLIRAMPKDLFAAFRATFEEAADADLIVEVIDASDVEYEEHLETTEAVLADLELAQKPRLRVYNKADRLEPDQRAAFGHQPGVCISALDGGDIEELWAALVAATPTHHRSTTELADVG
jgi:GTP-binding protein HflX